MLEEMRDNLKKNPEVETIKSKLNAIERVCNEFAGQKFVTEDVLAQFLACTLQKIAEMNKKQEANMRGYVSEYHMRIKEQFVKQQEGINTRQGRIENLLR